MSVCGANNIDKWEVEYIKILLRQNGIKNMPFSRIFQVMLENKLKTTQSSINTIIDALFQ